VRRRFEVLNLIFRPHHVPPLATAIDDPANIEKVTALREQIGKLVAAGKEDAARNTEEQAMRILGYRKP
jgi:hypothetical protein